MQVFILKMKNSSALLIAISLFFCVESLAQGNPFMVMAEKKYADYSEDLNSKYLHFLELDTIAARKVILQIAETANKTNRIEWELYTAYFELGLFERRLSLYKNNLHQAEELLKRAWQLLEKTKKENVVHLELMLRQKIIDYYWHYFKNYELAFEQYKIQEERLKEVSSDDIPEKIAYFVKIADAYFFFKDYAKAIFYYNIVLEEKDTIRARASYSKQHARNGLGLSYCDGYGDYDRSDGYFLAIMQAVKNYPGDESFSGIWNGIASGNLGNNMLLRGEYNKAIPLLKNSLEIMLKYGDYGYSIGLATNLARIYLKKGNLAQSKYYIDLAKDCYNKSPREGRLSHIYEVLSRYYAIMGNAALSMVYMDSTLAENKKYEEMFSALQMMRVEQRQHLSESKLREEQLNAEKIRSDGYQRSLIIIVVSLLLIVGVLLRYFVLYHKKQIAYRELVRKLQEWAQVSTEMVKPELIVEHEKHNESPDEVDFLIMKEIEKRMFEDKLYRDAALSVDLLANKLNAKRHNVSIAINRCMKKSFNSFVNEYRIKEAIQLLSKNDFNSLTIDTIAFDVGFNDRHNFYRVFKKMTGLSPTEFRKNVVK